MSHSSKSRPIYLDYHSTTPVDRRVAELMLHYMTTTFGNASSIDHTYGDEAEKAVSQAATHIAQLGREGKPRIAVSGDTTSRLAGNLHISIPDISNSAVIARVRSKLAISTGSACSSGIETPSHVLRALGLPDNLIEGALRIGLGKFTTDEEIEQAAEILSTAVSQVRQVMLTVLPESSRA